MRVRLQELGRVITGNTPSKSVTEYWLSPDICFIKPDSIRDYGITEISGSNEHLSNCARSKARIVGKSAVLVTCIGSIGKIGITASGEYAFNQQINAIEPNNKINPRYLAYALLFAKPRLIEIANAPVVPIINKAQFGDFELSIESDLSKQVSIVQTLDAVSKIIAMRQCQLRALDTLIKARFVEMFGDPVANPKGWEKRPLSEEAEIRIGPFGSLLHKEDYVTGGHALINPSHIIDGRIAPDNDLTLTDDKYEELAPYQLIVGDVVMGRRGEMGRCAVVDRPGLLCGTGSLLIRTNGDLSADYIQKIISFPSFKRTIEDMAVGQTMPNLNVPIVSAFQIIKPPKDVQKQYYAFISQVDKSKVVIQAALDKAQTLFDSLMQQYFG